MIIETITGNLADLAPSDLDGVHVERVPLAGADLVKRIQRVRTDHDREIGLRLSAPAGPDGDLRDGDILHRDAANIIAVRVLSTDVLVIAPRTVTEMGRTAHGLGNRHLQALFFDADSEYGAEVMVVQYDHTVEDYLAHHGVPFTRQHRVLPTPFRHAEHTH
ncbi:urease accessory protein UreE [Tsukamurella pseudospumae]|uniref:Urease accessory protein UreE n=1 Tax=Tsukamurella pseudospumae TaxID=239498 RepID=A0A138AKI4_9ACTN|nr:urease accessory protein UreE [Tsukamurella pseudospumae]KXP10837.1 Urease accessory protein UreE [Tsukamurella pseudospumae]